MSHQLEEGDQIRIDFDKLKSASSMSVVPVVVQDIQSQKVLIVAYANRKAFEYTLKNKVAAFWSTSRNELWIKGETSGEYLDIQEILVNCEQNALVYLVKIRKKGACHTKNQDGSRRLSCFYRKVSPANSKSLEHL